MIERVLKSKILENWDSGKVIIVLGPRQVGKTTLLDEICKDKPTVLFLSGDDVNIRMALEDAGLIELIRIIGKFQTVYIDEAQRIKNIGLVLKIIHDQLKHIRLLVSGSSSLELLSSINEPLTGRKWEYTLYPISFAELINHSGYLNAQQQLEQRIIYGMYPEIIMHPAEEYKILNQLSSSFLFKDLLDFRGIRKPEILSKLLVALALQLGSEVSYNELAQLLNTDRNTIETYIGLLEQSFVIFRLSPLSRNKRNEISSSRKIYFYDTGIRNALINNFNAFQLRNDLGPLWENFIIAERMKRNHYADHFCNRYFWRTHAQQEIDYIEEFNGILHAYEFKWNPKANASLPKSFLHAYPDSKFQIIHSQNFMEMLE